MSDIINIVKEKLKVNRWFIVKLWFGLLSILIVSNFVLYCGIDKQASSMNFIHASFVKQKLDQLADKNLLLPEEMNIELSEITRKIIEDDIKKMVLDELTKSGTNKKIEVKLQFNSNPLSDYTNKQIILKPEQVKQIQAHIQYLADSVKEAVANVHEEQQRNIDRLSWYLSVFLAGVGFVGVVLPLLLNIQSNGALRENSNEIRKEMNETKNNLLKDVTDKTDKAIVIIKENISTLDGNVNKLMTDYDVKMDKAREYGIQVESIQTRVESLELASRIQSSLSQLSAFNGQVIIGLTIEQTKEYIIKCLSNIADNIEKITITNDILPEAKELHNQLVLYLDNIILQRKYNDEDTYNFSTLLKDMAKVKDGIDYKDVRIMISNLIDDLK